MCLDGWAVVGSPVGTRINERKLGSLCSLRRAGEAAKAGGIAARHRAKSGDCARPIGTPGCEAKFGPLCGNDLRPRGPNGPGRIGKTRGVSF